MYVSRERAQLILADLVRHGLIAAGAAPASCSYNGAWDEERVMEKVAAAYGRQLVHVASLIHAKSASEAVRDFARLPAQRRGLMAPFVYLLGALDHPAVRHPAAAGLCARPQAAVAVERPVFRAASRCRTRCCSSTMVLLPASADLYLLRLATAAAAMLLLLYGLI